jgi:hypothetical protein
MADIKIDEFKQALLNACDASHVQNILKGQETILSMSRPWVISHINGIARDILDLSDEWHFRRLLELYQKIDPNLYHDLVDFGLQSSNDDIVEAAKDAE